MSQQLVKVIRGNLAESQHQGDLVVTNKNGDIIFSLGEPDKVTYWRSCAKPFQAIPLIELGGAEKFGLTGSEIALITSSHGGEQQHVDVARAILKKLNIPETILNCGIARPMHNPYTEKMIADRQSFSAFNNACSGKHGGMLALSLILGAPLEGYTDIDHPVQVKMLETICQCCSVLPEEVKLGVDGCGVPVFGMTLRNMSMAYARFSLPEGTLDSNRVRAINIIREAMTNNPFYVAGTDRLDTILMEVTRGKIVAKIGSEGVYCVGIVNQGIGITLKIEDGNYRPLDTIIIHVLKGLGYLSDAEFKLLEHLYQPKLKNHRGEEIGRLEVAFSM